MTKTIDTLVKDIYDVIEGKGGWDATIRDYFTKNIGDVLDSRLSPSPDEQGNRSGLRLSAMGTPCTRKLWYGVNMVDDDSFEREALPPSTRFKFLYGDILETLVLSLAKAAGHRVEGEQDVLHVAGIKGHRDCVIDGITVDVKSASTYAFQKFQTGGLRNDDPFGYISQLSSYVYAGREHPVPSHPTLGAFLVVDKTLGHICLDMYDFGHEIDTKEEEIEHIKHVTSQPSPPARLDDVPEGKSGNMKLCVNCSYCEWKKGCWPGLRTFKSSRGPVFLTQVKREPRMEEIT